MLPIRIPALVVVLGLSIALSVAAAPAPEGAAAADMDRTVKPGDDFYRFANGGWLKATALPAGRSSFDTRAILTAQTASRVRELIQSAAIGKSVKGSAAQMVGDYYASFMDEREIEAKGMTPLAGELARIGAITDQKSLSAYLGTTLNTEVDALTANADHVFGAFVNQSFTDSKHYVFHLLQGGLGLPDRDAYADASPPSAALRAQYQAHIAAMLRLAGFAEAETRAASIVALEVRIASSHAPDADAADVFKQNNPWTREQFTIRAPGMDWDAYFTAAGIAGQPELIVWQPSAVTGTAALVGSESIDTWKDYLRFHLIEHYSSVLPKAVADEHFAFYGKVLGGASETNPRDSDAIAATNAALGQAVGKLHTQRFFPPQAKAKAQAMVADLKAACGARIKDLAWMSPETKTKALAKLATLRVDVGYPDHWIDYSALRVTHGDAFGNMTRAEAFNRAQSLAKLTRPADPGEWRIDPQSVGAILNFSPNTETFSAGILQPPFFDYQGDAASNYGSAGAGMAHEISHTFDELGNLYDAEGRLGLWWTADDVARYHAAGAKLEAQFSRDCPFPDLCVNGKLVLSESIADQAGLLIAHDAYVRSLHGKADAVVAGLSGEQRFFLAFAQRWRKVQSEAALRRQMATDHHAPSEYRSDSVRNVEAWYKAYNVAPGDRLYLKPEERAGVW